MYSDLNHWLTQYLRGTNPQDRRLAAPNQEICLAKPWQIISSLRLDQTKTGCIRWSTLDTKNADGQLKTITENGLPTQLAETDGRHRA